MRNRSLALLALAVGTAGMVGCSTSQRNIWKVRSDAEHAYEFGRYETAEADWAEYVDRRPQDADGHYYYGLALLANGKPAPAREQLVIANDMRPDHEDTIEALASAIRATGNTDDLFRFLRRMIEERGIASDYDRLGRYLASVGNPDEAETAFLTAAQLDGGKTVAPQLALANFYRSIGDVQNEKLRLRMALALEPQNEDVQARLRGLGEVPGPSLALTPTEAQ
ncbi:MAG: tetratricopeptide repeat protein [Phycisphaerales bacterium]|jgi:tetratricopeptide (TPR) repeat protein|nr:tetratricopeptide repeat protein [Phycisphaerales bacterium]